MQTADVAVFWAHGDVRRVIVDVSYADAKDALKRVLRHFKGGMGHFAHVQSGVIRLDEPGGVVSVKLPRGHRAGLVRPYQAGELAGDEPMMIAVERRDVLTSPIVVSDVLTGRRVARRTNADHGEALAWKVYAGERGLRSLDVFAPRVSQTGAWVARSTLEELLVDSLRTAESRKRRRAAA